MAEAQAFTQFAAASYPALVRTAFLFVGDRGHAEDLVQSALLRTYTHWDELRSDVAAHAYTRRTMARLAGRWLRRHWHGELLIDGARGRDDRAPDTLGVRAAALDLHAALGRLPWAQRATLVLRFFEDLSEAETAQILRCSPGTVKSRASRGLSTLRSLLGEELPLDPDAPPATMTRRDTTHG